MNAESPRTRTEELAPPAPRSLPLIGLSPPMALLRRAIAKVAASDRPVLVQGPTGSGKELVVQAIHALGPDADAPLVNLNCAAVPEPLMEGQLFGWERGAFTGAERRQEGLFAAAGEGTLFLDEIGDLPLALQAKLLRVLETTSFRPLGVTAERRFAGRIVSATHVDLRERVRAGRFREDLYHRLSVLVLRVPPLDQRRRTCASWSSTSRGSSGARSRSPTRRSSSLAGAPWPGNVRQLRNAIDRIAVFADDCVIRGETIEELLAEMLEPGDADEERATLEALARRALATRARDKLEAMEAAMVNEALVLASGNRSQAARLLGVDRKVVERRLAARLRRERSGSPAG